MDILYTQGGLITAFGIFAKYDLGFGECLWCENEEVAQFHGYEYDTNDVSFNQGFIFSPTVVLWIWKIF